MIPRGLVDPGILLRNHRRWTGAFSWVVIVGSALMALAIPLWASKDKRGDQHQPNEASGVLLKIEANELTIQASGAPLVLTTTEDYRDEVAVGSEVTASYYPQESGLNVLQSLSYPAETFFVPVNEIARRVHRAIILPNSDVPDADLLWDGMRQYLQMRFGWYVAPPVLAAEITRRSAQAGSTLDAMDPASGNFDLSRYLNKSESTIPKVAAQVRADGVLEADVRQVQAHVSRLVASWDGTEEPLAGRTVRELAKLSMFSRKGEVPAATVTLKLWDAHGKLLWRNRRGLALLEVLEGKSSHLKQRPLPEFLFNTQAVQGWLDSVFKNISPEAHSADGKTR